MNWTSKKVIGTILGACGICVAGGITDAEMNRRHQAKKRAHERYIMNHPKEFEFATEVTRFEELQSENQKLREKTNSQRNEIRRLNQSVGYYQSRNDKMKSEHALELDRIRNERDSALIRLENYIQKDLNEVRKACGIVEPVNNQGGNV